MKPNPISPAVGKKIRNAKHAPLGPLENASIVVEAIEEDFAHVPVYHNKSIDIKSLLDRIDFSSDNVTEAATENAPLFRVAIDYRIECLRKRNAAKMQWEVAKADKELRLRDEARSAGDRLTERNLEALLLTDPAITELHKKYTESDENDEYSKLVVEAFRMRRDCLRIIGDLTPDDMSIQKALEAGQGKLSETRRKLKEKFPAR